MYEYSCKPRLVHDATVVGHGVAPMEDGERERHPLKISFAKFFILGYDMRVV